LASLAGVGGGVVMVPLLTRVGRFSFFKAAGLSSFAIVLISITASFQMASLVNTTAGITPFSLGYVDFGVALPLSLMSVIGAAIAVNSAPRVNPLLLRWTFVAFIMIVIIDLLSGL
jgi:uncharacterized membrane protein YfcA